MKTITPALKTAIESEVATVATLWKITRVDGFILTFTDHDKDITYAGDIYDAASGFTPSSIDTSTGLKVDNLEVTSILDSANIKIADIEAGLYDFARVEVSKIDYLNIGAGIMVDKVGTIGNIKRTAEMFVAEVRGLSQYYTNTITEEYTPTCRASLGDVRCKFALQTLKVNGTILSVIDEYTFTTALTDADDYWKYGNIKFITGNNATFNMEIKISLLLNGELHLFLKLPFSLAVGDTFEIVPGCDKSLNVCKVKFNNIVNFRGEPFVPSKDRLITGK